ncbi:Retinol dehydrogenase 13 [Lamellibrachia satsuma]|nr:Retinol dehydrogenase 13 [Lamellibrachia satsuma]
MRPIKLPKYVVPISIVGTTIGAFILFRDKMAGEKYVGEERIPGKTAIVTGANTGLGKATAKELANRGARVIMACRDMKKCEEARAEIIEATYNKKVFCKKLDLASLESVREFADDIKANERRLDILINNAGLMGVPKRELTHDGFEMHLGVNHLGPFLLTNLLLDKLKACAPSRVVTVTSIVYRKAQIEFSNLNSARDYDSRWAYMQSKLANVLFSVELARQLEGTNVSTYVVHPGLSRTELGRHMNMNQSYLSSSILGPFWSLIFKTPDEAIQTAMKCALDPELEKESGKFYMECHEADLERVAENKETATRLWAISEKWTRLK